MPSLKDLKNRINSVKSTRKITKAMQMVAAAKLRRAQEAAVAARPYADRFGAVLADLARAGANLDSAPLLLRGTGRDDVHLLVVMTGERGLAGGFNSSIVRLARQHIDELLAAGKKVKILTVGKKGREMLRRDHADMLISHVDMTEMKRPGYLNARSIADQLLDRFAAGEFDVATIFYNRFVSVISQKSTALQVIPAAFEPRENQEAPTTVYEYEPQEDTILAEMLPRAVATHLFGALLENNASFYGAQMTAMDNATRNAGDMIDRLTIVYNRSRQAAITKELIEIISGAEAL